MTNSQSVLLDMLKASVKKKFLDCQSITSNINWNEVLDLASHQGVLGIAFDTLELLPAKRHPAKQILLEWLGKVMYMEKMYEKHRTAIVDIASFYEAEGINMMLLKGYGLSLNWPTPKHRPVGDIDTFNFGIHNLADKMVYEKLGIEIDNSHHKHSVFTYKSVMIENHFSFLNTHGHKSSAEIEKILISLSKKDLCQESEISNLYLPSSKFNALYLLRHSGEHFASVDLNLRQVLDWGFFVKNNPIDWEWLLTTLDKVGMKKHMSVLNAICIKYLGFEATLFPELQVNETLVERSIMDILHPEVEAQHHKNPVLEVFFRFKRWWKNSWKHDMVYRENRWQSLMTQMWSHILKPTL